MAIRTANARWEGTFSDGTGIMRTGKGGLEANFSAKSRFEEGEGSNPEELIGAAHAGCFSMALAKALGEAGFPPTSVETTANVHLDRVDGKATVTRIDLTTTAVVPNIDEAEFRKHAEATKEGCPISRLLSPGAEITLNATLAS
ncbi:MAG TPA: OsmC family protein [Micromonosporaceae bacterium]|nr:OsmC family protein [Micromonosporaceae bacterium]